MDFHFDPTEIEDVDLVPIGTYDCVIESIDHKMNQQGSGEIIKVVLLIVGPECASRKLFDNINWTNLNEVAQTMGRKTFKKLVISAFGEAKAITSVHDLVSQPVTVRVTHRKVGDDLREQITYLKSEAPF